MSDASVAGLLERFRNAFKSDAEVIVRAPGRVNIIGEHTDYNHGFVLPMALERVTAIAARRRGDRRLNAFAADLGAHAVAELDRRVRNPEAPWMDYLVGVADELAKLDLPLAGADLLISGDVPIGCGLSSSAALEMAALTLFEHLGGFQVEGAEGPRLGQRVENVFLGLSTGIMDQFISRMGRAGHALFLDCRSFAYDLIPITSDNAVFVVANTGVSRGLTASKYNERVAECREAVAALRKVTGKEGTHLRDFSLNELSVCRTALREVAYRRARHVITENARTEAACAAMRQGDLNRLGAFMTASDASLREDYEVTCSELDAMTRIARELPGCLGARMTGAGFGGCTINLVETAHAADFGARLLSAYENATSRKGDIIVSKPGDGASVAYAAH